MISKLVRCGLFTFCLVLMHAVRVVADVPTRGQARATMVRQAPKFDGSLADPTWQTAPALELGDCISAKASPESTTARLLIDQRQLYVGIECAEKETAAPAVAEHAADEGDSVEVWIWADPDRPVRRLRIDAAGGLTAVAVRGDQNIAWKSEAQVKTQIQPGRGWTATLAIPLRDLDAYAGKDLTWRVNFTRVRPARGAEAAFESSWAVLPTREFNQPEQFGRLEGVNIVAAADGVTRTRPAAVWPAGPQFPREEIHLADSGPDEAVTNLRIANDRWVDCYDDATALHDMFRLEGVLDKDGQAKALALWKWYRILVSASCGGYCYEASAGGGETLVHAPHEIFTVYGHHQCDGLSWGMAGLWRAGGYIGFDECHTGHTIVSLRYQDADGQWRFHDLDPQGRYYFWDAAKNIIGTWTMPLISDRVHRHLTCSQYVHDLHRSLRAGETMDWLWNNEGHVIPPEVQKKQVVLPKIYIHTPGKTTGVFAAVGQETQTLTAELSPAHFNEPLAEGSDNVAASSPADGQATLHPLRKGSRGVFIYRMQSAYPAVDASVTATLVKGAAADTCRLWLSTDGGFNWQIIRDQKDAGTTPVSIDLGTSARAQDKPNVYTIYDFLIKAEFASDTDATRVGMNDLKITAYRQLNKRTLPNLMPGENAFRVSFDRLAAGKLLDLEINYSVDGKPAQVVKHVAASPFYFRIDTGDVKEKWLKNYDQAFNVGALQMDSIKFHVRDISAGDAAAEKADASDPAVTEDAFKKPYPHPADMTDTKAVKQSEIDPIQTSGFFPQSHAVRHDPAAMEALIQTLKTGQTMPQWVAAQSLGDYPDALDVLLAEWPKANDDLKLHLCNALAQIHDRRALAAVLAVWANMPHGAPGTRYIPDVLAAIGDRSVVPALVAPLHGLRFDYRFHIAHALGQLGGKEAEAVLADLAQNDPFDGVREYAGEMLKELKARPAGAN